MESLIWMFLLVRKTGSGLHCLWGRVCARARLFLSQALRAFSSGDERRHSPTCQFVHRLSYDAVSWKANIMSQFICFSFQDDFKDYRGQHIFLNEDISLSLWDVICTSLSTQPNISYFIFSNLFINEMLLRPQGLPFNTGSYAASPCPRPRGLTRWWLHRHLYPSSKTPLSASILSFASWQFPEPAVDYSGAHSFWFLGLVLVALIFRAISCDIISVLLSIWSSWPLALLLLLIVLLYSLVSSHRFVHPFSPTSHPTYFLPLSFASSSALSLALSLCLFGTRLDFSAS